MPSYKFTDQENKTWEPLPPGDYVGRVTACEFTLSKGGKTAGSDQMELTLECEGNGRKSDVYETLIFHPSCGWKVDTFVKSFNLLIDDKAPAKDQDVNFTEKMVVGLRGWVTLKIEEFKKRDGGVGVSNRVAVFITNKEKLAKVIEAPVEATATADEGLPF